MIKYADRSNTIYGIIKNAPPKYISNDSSLPKIHKKKETAIAVLEKDTIFNCLNLFLKWKIEKIDNKIDSIKNNDGYCNSFIITKPPSAFIKTGA